MIRTRDLVSSGLSDSAIKKVRARSARVRHGVYVESIGNPWHGYLLLCRAVLAALNPGAVLTGPSAALAWDLPLIGSPPAQVWIRGITPGRYAKEVKVVSKEVPGRAMRSGMFTVTPAWAVADCARLLDRRAALAVADAALHADLCQVGELVHVAGRCRGFPGVGQLRWVTRAANALAESPGESWMRMVVQDLGYAVVPQVPVEDGDFRARLDLLLEATMLALEFDGLVKYEDRDEAGKVLLAEKERQARLEAIGFTVLRVTWSQLSDPQLLDRRIRAALRVAPQV